MDWRALMALGLGRLALAPDAFWALTPPELRAAAGALAGPSIADAAFPRAALAALMARFPDSPAAEQEPRNERP